MTLTVTDATGDPPVELEALKVAAGTATLTIPPGMKSGTLIVRDAVSGTSVTITVVEKQ